MESTLKIFSLNISLERGTIKSPVDSVTITKEGILEDAHKGDWHRQVSILSKESIDKFEKTLNRHIAPGEFAENITLNGLDSSSIKIHDRFICGTVELEVTQIGKKCHGTNCEIFKQTGDCIMPREGIFCKVLNGGVLTMSNSLHLIRSEQ